MKKILTGTSALYKQNLISYYPSKEHFEMILGTNTSNYKNIRISLQKESTINIGSIEIDEQLYYCPERLFIELNKFDLENTIKTEAIKKLKEVMEPEKVKKYYQLLKKQRRGLDHKMIQEYLNKNLLSIKELLSSSKDKKSIIREYLMALISSKGIPVSLIKGGSSIELYTKINRTTLDIDAHTGKNSIKKILEYLFSKDRPIYFKLNDDELSIKNFKKISDGSELMTIIKLQLIPLSRGGSNKEELKNIILPISFNMTYSEEELLQIIKEYRMSKRPLKHLSNVSAILFSREMLLAEKFQSIINKPENSTRTKDLIDLKLLWEKNVDFNKFRKWFFRKALTGRNPKSGEEAIKMIKTNSSKPLTKIKSNFDEAIRMYDANIKYDECISIYKILIQEALKGVI